MTSKTSGLFAPDAQAGRLHDAPFLRPASGAASGPARADLHIHSTCSDGLRPPAELARMAYAARLTHIALCDHDSVAGNAALADALDALAMELAAGRAESATRDARGSRAARECLFPFGARPAGKPAEPSAVPADKPAQQIPFRAGRPAEHAVPAGKPAEHVLPSDKPTGAAADPFAAQTAPSAARPARTASKPADRPVPLALPGVELSCGPDGHIHVLGYGMDIQNAALLAFLADAKARRRARADETLERLRKLGLCVPPEFLPTDGDEPVGRAHIARALIRMGACATVPQAFGRWLADGKPAFVPQVRPPAAEGVRLILAAGGVPVLAHPMRLGLSEMNVCALLEELTTAGLRGVEAYHSSSGRAEARMLLAQARRLGLLTTGGSDYHGDRASAVRLGDVAPGWDSQRADVAALWAACGRG